MSAARDERHLASLQASLDAESSRFDERKKEVTTRFSCPFPSLTPLFSSAIKYPLSNLAHRPARRISAT